MKNKFFYAVLLNCIVLMGEAQAQWNFTGGNTINLTTEYLGTNGTSTSPLQFKTIETGVNALPINFFTDNTLQMTLTSGGWLGLNTSAPPQSILHIDGNLTNTGELFRTVSPAGTQSYWRMFDNTNEIFNINGTNAGAVTLYSMATGGLKILSSSTTAPILIQSAYNEIELGGVGGGSPLLTTGTQYLRIGTSVVTNQTDFSSVNVGVGELFDDPYWSMVLRKDQPGLFPGSTCLQFENNVVTHIGQFTGFTMGIESDGDAILQQNEDNYQISFLTTPVTHATDVGPCVERMRIESSGEVGIGNYRNIPYIPPTRRLEVLDNGLDSPQFRLTYTQNANVNLGIHTDFQTTSLGDLYINPFDGTNNRKVGINTSTPVATLEVFDASSIPKLRLTDTLGKKFTDFLSDASGNLTIDPVGTTSAYGNMGYVQICPLFLGANPNLALIVNGQENIYTVSPNDTLSNILVWNPATTTIERRNANTLGFGTCANPTQLSSDAVINLNNNNYYFENQGVPGNNVAIGIDCTNPPGAKLDVLQQISTGAPPIAGNFHITSSSGQTGRYSALNANCDVINGISPWPLFYNIGGEFQASNAGFNFGIFSTSMGSQGHNVAGIFLASGPNSIGLSAAATGSNSWAAMFEGYEFTSGGTWQASDSILKTNIQPISNPLGIINSLIPRKYYFDTTTYWYLNLPTELQYGFIAQQAGSILPNIIRNVNQPAEYDSTGTMIHDSLTFTAINPGEIIPILVGAVKQLDSLQQLNPDSAQNGVSIKTDTIHHYSTPDTYTNHIEWGGTPLLHNTIIPMVDSATTFEWNIYFTGQSVMNSGNPADVGIGINADSFLRAKLDVSNFNSTGDSYNYINLYAARFINTGTGAGSTYLSELLNPFAGIYASSNVSGAYVNVGADFYASNGSDENIGARGQSSDSSGTLNIGVEGNANNGTLNIGVYGDPTGLEYGKIGVYGSGSIGIYGYGATYGAYFTGDVYTTGCYLPSDSKLKTQIQSVNIDSAEMVIMSLLPKTYYYDKTTYSKMQLPSGRQYGFLSDDVVKLLPNLVKNTKTPPTIDSTGKPDMKDTVSFKALNYIGLMPILVAANQSQQNKIDSQQKQIDTLKAQSARNNAAIQQLLNCCQSQNQGSNNPGGRSEDTIGVTLNNLEIVIFQNDPNPFSEQTQINYLIPSTVQNAQIKFWDNNGVVLNTVTITGRGAGSIVVYASNLSSGIYTYALIADGKLIDSKKMVCQK